MLQVLAPLIPFLMVFTIASTKSICYNNLQYIVPSHIIQKHIFRAICMCQMLGGTGTREAPCGRSPC